MPETVYRYEFAPAVALDEVEETLVLAILATESLHGEAQVRLDAAHLLDRERRACVIEADTAVGRDFNRLFTGFIRHEFGEYSFAVARVEGGPLTQPREVATGA
jgi:hypothetical protein